VKDRLRLAALLGNPGPEYERTRHNIGFMLADLAASRLAPGERWRDWKGLGLYVAFEMGGENCFLLKPQTYMNLSGQSVAAALRYHKLTLDDLIVIHDDLDIPFGRIKVKKGGGHGGHNGLRSLLKELGSGEFVRIRVGIDRKTAGDTADYVLSPFTNDEFARVPELLDQIVEALHLLVTEGFAKTMSLYNNRDLLSG